VLIVTAHYDHLGIVDNKTYYGADDNGSGTSSILEIAEAFSLAVEQGFQPKRSILFMCVAGEEKGLLGSKYYIENPVYPYDKTIANLNIDMIGRSDAAHKSNPNYVYLIGSDKLSKDLHQLSEAVNRNTVKMELDYTYNRENDPNRFYYRSDHYNFAKEGIPVIFYFSGVHSDYHKPSDTIDKLNLDKIKTTAQLVFYTIWEIVNREEDIQRN
jgi:Zn-dependent M28 family amino/carboxypeptidase